MSERTVAPPGLLRRWLIAHFSGIDHREAWGYGVWLFFGVLVLVPELWAAFWGDSARWPTISGTVGALEYDYPVLALVVVGVIVLCVYSAFRYPPDRTGVLPVSDAPSEEAGGMEGDPALPYRTPSGGRLTRSTAPVREVGAVLYFGIALLVIVFCTSVAAATTDIDDEFPVGRTLYGLTALFWVVIPSLLAWPKHRAIDVPFPTLFETVRNLERRLRIVALTVAAGLVILLIHLVLYPWPSNIPDLSRLHRYYECHPLEPAKHPLSAKAQAACKKLEEEEVQPSPVAP
ncbi:MAG: hypothetical protein AABM30_01350 [Actinomycetota bacterium]